MRDEKMTKYKGIGYEQTQKEKNDEIAEYNMNQTLPQFGYREGF
jgi:hypothetical protein